jgi:hypothetical protein
VALAAVLGLALVESIAALFAYRPTIDDEDWAAISSALEPGVPVFVATDWLDPTARMWLAPVAAPSALGRPDLRGIPRFAVVGAAGTRWSDGLEADLEDRPAPRLDHEERHGGLQVSFWAQEAVPPIDDLLADASRLSITTARGACRREGTRFTCGDPRGTPGRVEVALAEIDYRPRRCLVFDLPAGEAATVTVPDFGLGTVLRGHVGFPDFNARLRSEGAVAVTLDVDERRVGRIVAGDAQGWHPIAFAGPTARGELRVHVRSAARRAVCLELRGFSDAEAR